MTAASTLCRLSRLLRPRHIAVFGGSHAERVIAQSQRAGYGGDIWPVHPQRRRVGGLQAYPTVTDLPTAPDACFLGINRHRTVRAVADLAALGAGGAVCFASGFAEVDAAGAALQAELIAAAGAMPILGPNCYGFINYLDRALLWPDQHGGEPTERGVAVISQSSNIALNITMARRALPLAYVLTVGNQSVVGVAELVEALAEDSRVSAIGLYLEGMGEAQRFAAAIQRAREAAIPVVSLLIGRSQSGRSLALTHTASMAGGDLAMDAFLERLGVARLHNLPAFLETLKLLHCAGPLPGRDLVSLSCSGGEAGLVADAALATGLRFRAFSESERAQILPTLNPLVTLSNPFDYHTFDWADPTRLAATFAMVLRCRFDLALLILDLPRPDRCETADWEATLSAWLTATEGCYGATAVVATLPELMPETVAQSLLARGVAPLMGLDEALAAAAAATKVGGVQTPYSPWPHRLRRHDVGATVLGEWSAKRRLAELGVEVPDGRLCADRAALEQALVELRFPLVAKAAGAQLVHKSELGAVRLGLTTPASARDAFMALRPLGEAVLVEEMAGGGIAELILGLNRDPVIGLHLVAGAGGVLAELMRDRVAVVLPATAAEIEAALLRLRIGALLQGYRGGPAADLKAAVAAAMALQRLAEQEQDSLLEVDINPLILRASGHGAVAVDALISRVLN